LKTAALVLALVAAAALAGAAPEEAARRSPELVVYVREGCPACARAKAFLAELARERPDLAIAYRAVDADASAREDLIRVSRENRVATPGVPTFVVRGRILVGFEDAERTGPALRALLDSPAGEPGFGSTGSLRWSESELGLPLFTLAMGLLDGFNPCATWVLLFLLSLLVHLRDRRRMALVAATFVLVGGAVYYAFLAAWLNAFLALGMSAGLRLALGALALAIGAINVKDFFAFGRGPTLAIPESAKPGLYARMRRVLRAEALPGSLAAVAVLAVAVNFVELLCTAGFPALYTAVLAQHELGPAAHYAYLGLYILGYVADDAAMVAVAVITLGNRKLTERGGRWLKLLSGAVMVALGVVLILRPDWLQ
jgi:glutaredoxin